MKILMQRVDWAKLTSLDFKSEIGFGVLAYVGVNENDTIYDVKFLAKKIANLRMFEDDMGKTNLSLLDVKADIMIVSNFTLQADTRKGHRPDFIHAAKRDKALDLYLKLVDEVSSLGLHTEHGNFGEHMDISTSLNGPFTLILEAEGREHEWSTRKIF